MPPVHPTPAVPPSASEHPATGKFGYPIYHALSRAQWRAWLTAHHAVARGVWLCSWRTAVAGERCPYPEVVEEAICFGWIDSTVTLLDERRALQLVTPRKAKSGWTRLNRQRAADMEAAGLMADAGRRAIEVAQVNGWWTIADPVEDLLEPPDLAAALDGSPAARATWDAFPASARKQMLWWIVSAGRPETRAARISAVTADAAAGRRAARRSIAGRLAGTGSACTDPARSNAGALACCECSASHTACRKSRAGRTSSDQRISSRQGGLIPTERNEVN